MAFSAAQIKRLSDKLDSIHVKTRRARGADLVYIEGWHAISEANRIFGYDAWDRQTLSVKCVWIGKIQDGYAATYTAKARIRVRAGHITIIREGCGTGEGKGRTAGEAHDTALKAAETDATKRALATFGNPFGLALYDRNLAGVRRPGKIARPSIEERDTVWPLCSASGAQEDVFDSAEAFAEALGGALRAARDIEILFRLWEHNSAALRALHRLNGSDGLPITAKNLAAQFKARAIALAKGHGDDDSGTETTGTPEDLPQQAQTGRARINKSELRFGEPRRVRSKEHLKFVTDQNCLICGRRPSQAHHIRYAQPRALGSKVSDEYVVPLCSAHHDAVHRAGDEKSWWLGQGLDPLAIAERLWKSGGTRRGDEENRSQEPMTPI